MTDVLTRKAAIEKLESAATNASAFLLLLLHAGFSGRGAEGVRQLIQHHADNLKDAAKESMRVKDNA